MTPELMALRWFGLALLWMVVWSTTIGVDAPWPQEPPAPAAPEVAKGRRATTKPLPKGKVSQPRPLLPVDTEAALDRQAFILAFKRQSDSDLLTCLQQWAPSPGSAAVSAVLDRQGRLRHLLSLNPAQPLPDCAEEAVAAMAFKASGAQLVRPTVTLQWRIDW